MASFLQELEQDPFDPEEFVERLAWRTAGGYGEGETFNPDVLHKAFEDAISFLHVEYENTQQKCERLEIICHEGEKLYWAEMVQLMEKNKEGFSVFKDLDERIDYVATKVVHLGEQLESVNIPRARAVEAQKLMTHFAEFLNNETPLNKILSNPDELFQAADVILKLHLIAQELPPGKFDVAQRSIAAKYDEIERTLIEAFVHAQLCDDRVRMKEVAAITSQFKGYSQCINAFIEQCQSSLYLDDNIFDGVVPLCKRNQVIMEQVFNDPQHIMAKFILNLYQLKLEAYITSKLEDRSNPNTYLHILHELYSKTNKLSTELSSLKMGTDAPSYLSKLTRILFSRYLDTYIMLEAQSLKDKCCFVLRKYYDKKKHQKKQFTGMHEFGWEIRAKLNNLNITQTIESYGGETFLSEEVAISLLQESKLALQRCHMLSKPSDIPANSVKIFEILIHYLCIEHIDYALELGLHGVPHPETKTTPEIHFFNVAQQCNSIFHLLEKQFLDTLVPLVISTPKHSECLQKKKAIMEQMETKLQTGLDRCIATITGWVKTLLQSLQRKTDFKTEPDAEDGAPMTTDACKSVTKFIKDKSTKIKATLDGKNIEAVLTELGLRLHRIIYEHLLQFQYTTFGAMVLLCDVNEYRKYLKEFNVPMLNNLINTLHALCNLLLVKPDNLKQVCSGDQLAGLPPAVLINFVQLRADFKTEKLMSRFK